MTIDIDKIVGHLFQNKTLSELSEKEMQELVDTYPYFTPGRFLLAKKLLNDGSTNADDEIATAALYFHNPLWLQWLLTEQKFPHDTKEEIPDQVVQTEPPQKEHEMIVETNEKFFGEQPLVSADEKIPFENKRSENQDETSEEAVNVQTSEEGQNAPVTESERERVVEEINNTDAEVSVQQNEKPVFEPYHTIDYFASQGIKLLQGDLTKDKFGQQLKSFTEWLRSMKRLPNAAEIKMDHTTERSIQNIAENSLQEKEILTEAMAEVWAKQGNAEKAIEIYQKLSLINPDKSAYFAARIEQLKAS